jgi:nicotinamidase-related amidase
LIVDMQADFAAPDGVMALAGADMSRIPAALASAQRLTDAARSAAAAVIFVGLRTSADTDSASWAERTRRLGADPGRFPCRKDERGSEFYGPTPRAGEVIIAKTRYSAFFTTELDRLLRDRGFDTLLVCGLTTECCVDCTVRDAFQLDYHTFVATDACATYVDELHASTLTALELNCAILVTSEAIVKAWSTRT